MSGRSRPVDDPNKMALYGSELARLADVARRMRSFGLPTDALQQAAVPLAQAFMDASGMPRLLSPLSVMLYREGIGL